MSFVSFEKYIGRVKFWIWLSMFALMIGSFILVVFFCTLLGGAAGYVINGMGALAVKTMNENMANTAVQQIAVKGGQQGAMLGVGFGVVTGVVFSIGLAQDTANFLRTHDFISTCKATWKKRLLHYNKQKEAKKAGKDCLPQSNKTGA